MNFLWSMRQQPGLSASDIMAAVTTISFDIAVLELYLPLMMGACIELVPRETATDGAALTDLLETSGATMLQATPATWRLLGLHLAEGLLGAQERPGQVHAHYFRPLLITQIFEGDAGRIHAGIVEQNVQPAEPVAGTGK